MAAGPLPCSLIEFYRHINNSQAAEREGGGAERVIERKIERKREEMERERNRLLMLVFTGGGF